MANHKVKLINQPDVELVVDDAELLDLTRFGLVESEKTTTKKKEDE